MNKKQINRLVLESYKKNRLDKKKINRIVTLISRSDLKKYLSALKIQEKKAMLIVSTPADNPLSDEKLFRKLFPNKKIIFKNDKSLLLGMQIVDYDVIHNFTLKSSLDKIISRIEKDY